MTTPQISTLFASKIDREIEEVIKVDQTDETIIGMEIDEYIVTDAIASHYVEILDRYDGTFNREHEGIAIWISGFFGSGKSSFAKNLGLAIENRRIGSQPASERFAARTSDKKIPVLLKQIIERIPTHAVIFDVSTDRGIRAGNQTLTQIMYRLFLESLDYPRDLDLAELEIGLEQDGDLEEFKARFREVTGKEWDKRKFIVAFALTEASAAMHALRPAIHADADSWFQAHAGRADITPRLLATRVKNLVAQRKPGHSVLFVIDEVGQFVARDVDKMLDLQAIVQQFGVHGRGKQWIAVTSQEKLSELVSGLDDNRIELARLMDRFKSQVHLEPSDIAEVTSKRVLTKNANAEATLGSLFDNHRGQLASHTRLSADIALPELSRQGFVDLYPLLPYQIDLIIQVVSGLRTQGGSSKHSGGANRTIIKLAQQLLIHQKVRLADEAIGRLARLDQIYDLVESNIASEIRTKIHQIGTTAEHPMAEPVAKAICLLQFVKSVHRTAENFAATLYPGLGAPAVLESVKDALRELEASNQVRAGDDGYRIPTPAEDDWDRVRMGMSPKPSDLKRLHREILSGFWAPQPTFSLLDVKQFKAGLVIDGREEEKGDVPVFVAFADEGAEFTTVAEGLRKRSQTETETIFWAVAATGAMDRESVELFRSREMLSKKAREARTAAEQHLIAEEQARARRHQSELQRLLRAACLQGLVYFRGNDRSPGVRIADVAKATTAILSQILPDVFTKFGEAAAKGQDVKRGFEALLTAADLQGLPPVFAALGLLRDEGGKTVFDLDAPPLREVMAEIEDGAVYGVKATGKSLVEQFARAPCGWDFEVVRLFVAALLRAGAIQMTHKANTIDSISVAARDGLSNNNHFKAASFQPKKGVGFDDIAKAATHYEATFGVEAKELALSPLVAELRSQILSKQDTMEHARAVLQSAVLPGMTVLDDALTETRAILRGAEEAAISVFNAAHQTIKEGIRRASELESELTRPAIADLAAAQRVMLTRWPILDREPDVDEALRAAAGGLRDLLGRETFFRELGEIQRNAALISEGYDDRFGVALAEKVATYQAALAHLLDLPVWSELLPEVRDELTAQLRVHAEDTGAGEPILAQLRADRDACVGRLQALVRRAHEIAEGDRIATLDVRTYFRGGVEDTEQLEAAITGLREECERLIADGKKIVVS